MSAHSAWHTEGRARFQIGTAFYNPAGRCNRDLGVLAAAWYRAERGTLRLLDATSGCGVRALRYALESEASAIAVNEANPDLQTLLQSNLAPLRATHHLQLSQRNARHLLAACASERNYFDFIDLDCFGSAAPYLPQALGALQLGGLLYVASTDSRAATGHQPDASLRAYGAFARAQPAAREQALRLLLGALQQQAASLDLGIQPGLALWTGSTYRVLVRLQSKPALTPANYAFLGYCHACGEYQTIAWRQLGRVACACGQPLTHSGPLWLGPLHDRAFLTALQTLAQAWQWFDRCDLLATLIGELELPPYYYTLGEIGRRGKLDVPPRSRLIAALHARGERAAPTHCDPQAIKTTASLADCIAIARQLGC